MKAAAAFLAAVLATSAGAQATNDDTSSTENWWDKVGADFFGEGTLFTHRPEYEIRAQWTALSEDDQAAVLARCAAGEGSDTAGAASLQEGDEDNAPDATDEDLADTTTGDLAAEEPTTETANSTSATGSVAGVEGQVPSPDVQPAPYTGLAGGIQDGATQMVRVCDLIPSL